VRPGRARRWLLRWPSLFVRLYAPDDAELGRLGEEVAARALRRCGFRILARGLRTPSGEADLVIASPSFRAVVEVKTGRASTVPRPLSAAPRTAPRGAAAWSAIDLRWRPGHRCDARRIARLRAVGRRVHADRIDLVEVFFLESSRRFRVLHHEDVRRPLDEAPGPALERAPWDLR
jgi:hypothetical protein